MTATSGFLTVHEIRFRFRPGPRWRAYSVPQLA